jgi:hypothetical protein
MKMQAKSSAGSITIEGDLVSFSRASLPGLVGPVRSVAISDLVGLDLRQATAFEPGYVRLIYSGASAGLAGQLRLYDPDTIMFGIEHQDNFLAMHDALMTMIGGKPFVTPRQPIPARSSLKVLASLIGAVTGFSLLGWWIFS